MHFAGGDNYQEDKVYVYDFSADIWTELPPLQEPRSVFDTDCKTKT